MRNTSEAQAYDLSLFENREPRMRVIKNEKPLPQKKSTPAAKILLAAVVVILAGMMLYSRVQLVELGDDLRAAKTELESTQSETTRLNMQVESKMSLAHDGGYAKTPWGWSRWTTSRSSTSVSTRRTRSMWQKTTSRPRASWGPSAAK